MARIRKEYKYGFTTVSNEMYRDNRLSLKDRGLLGTMLSLPDYWDFSIRGLASMLEDGVTAIGASLRKLEETGYLKRTRIKKGGKIVDWEYSFSDSPIYKDEGALLKLARAKKAENDFKESINHQDPLGENQDTENLNIENEEQLPDVEKPYVENQDTENLDLDYKHLENLTQLNTKE
ncbi:MAG: hypothetical protein Q4C00_07350, partial [Bacillota bacterium]|nr:hypothetical protein [Bacillota bacterium]